MAGTPSAVADRVLLSIDGHEVNAKPGATILQAAQAAGIRIPATSPA
jgi:NADH dehydrogenase/NADH:ubiquinone oxidoreductase subunit G